MTNPNAIFSAALANGPHVEPFDVGQWMDQRTVRQAQAANLQSEAGVNQQQAQGLALKNQAEQIQLQLEQQRRDLAKQYTSQVPSTPPPSGFPAPPQPTGSDDIGNPIYPPDPTTGAPGIAGYHAAAAAASNPVPHFDLNGYSVGLMKNGDPEGAITAAKTAQALHEKDLTNAKTELENLQAKNSQAGQMLGGLLQSAQPKWADGDFSIDPDGLAKADAQYQALKPQLAQLGVPVQDHFDPSWASPAHDALIGRDKAITEHNAILSGKGTEAETGLRKSQAGQAEAQTKLINEQVAELTASNKAMEEYIKDPSAEFGPKGRISQLGLDKDSTNAVTAQIADIIHGPGTPSEKVRAVFAAKQKAIDDQHSFNKETRLIPIREAASLAASRARSEADNPQLAGVPPALASKAVSDANKLDQDYSKARAATEAMGNLLDLADKGNTAAGANIPMVGVGAANAINSIKRINSAEIAQYGSAGSLIQKIQGKLEGWTEGQPITASVRDDIRELHQQLGEDSYKQYTTSLASLNKRTGAKFQPTIDAPNIRKAPAIAPTVTTKADYDKLPSGAVYIDSQDGKKYTKK